MYGRMYGVMDGRMFPFRRFFPCMCCRTYVCTDVVHVIRAVSDMLAARSVCRSSLQPEFRWHLLFFCYVSRQVRRILLRILRFG